MTAGCIAIGVKRRCQHRVKEEAVIVGTMEFGMAVDAVDARCHAGMGSTVSGRNAMALLADAVFRLIEQLLVGRTVGTVAFDTAAAVNQMAGHHRMLEHMRTRVIRMAGLAGKVESGREHHVLAIAH